MCARTCSNACALLLIVDWKHPIGFEPLLQKTQHGTSLAATDVPLLRLVRAMASLRLIDHVIARKRQKAPPPAPPRAMADETAVLREQVNRLQRELDTEKAKVGCVPRRW